VEKSVIEIVAWTGAIILMIAPFYSNLKLISGHMVIGLSLLTIQAVNEELYNLVILNSVGIVAWLLKFKKETENEKARID
jgi:hypothetical protein